MNANILRSISELLGEPIVQCKSVAGGDISAVHKIETKNNRFIVKSSSDKSAKEMFQAEKNGLEVIGATNVISVPEVLFVDQKDKTSFLIMEFCESKSAQPADYARLGHELAELHKCSASLFGGDHHNFIGSLSQVNNQSPSWPAFYASERIMPQFELARSRGFLTTRELVDDNKVLETCRDLFPEIAPSLLHGDLWSGNYLISSTGIPYLIDPAVYYGHNEVDLAMTRLFGGFGGAFYDTYDESLPALPGNAERCEIYQLYYLLVHLNLFGRSYYPAVKRIIDRYF